MNEDVEIYVDDEIGEKEWLEGASKNDVFKFLNDESEDIYDLSDGISIE